jgi:NAD(P)H-hydrate epimerase
VTLSVEQIRSVDKIAVETFGMSSLVLMENAGRGAADWILSQTHIASQVTILCGGGNNGGDGLVIARHLYAGRRNVEVFMFAARDRLSPDCLVNLLILEKTRLSISWCPPLDTESVAQSISKSSLIVDALLGTGAKGNPRESMAAAIEAANKAHGRRIAIDVPTGLDAETGKPGSPTFHAGDTLTFVDTKTGFEAASAKRWTGMVHILPIGIPPEILRLVREDDSVSN